MFAAQHPPSTPFRQTRHYTPARPSPLGPRSSNIATPPWTMDSPSCSGNHHKPGMDENTQCSPVSFPTFSLHTDQSQHQHQYQNQYQTPLSNGAPASSPNLFSTHATSTFMSPTSPSPSTRPRYADRYASKIANPMKGATSLARSKTCKMFLNRVRNERDTDRFEARGEQMMMAEHLADKRRWEESMARDADGILGGFDGEDEMLPDEVDLVELDEYISEEQAMEMALKETMVSTNSEHFHRSADSISFSDDEYDDIFTTLTHPAELNNEMDMS